MKAIINTLRKTNSINQDSLYANRDIFKVGNTRNGLWNGAKRYAY